MRFVSSQLFRVALVALLVVVCQPAMAADYGVINIQRIMQDSKAAQSVRAQLQSKQKAFQGELDAKQKQLVTEDQQLAAQRSKLSKEAFEKKVKEFQAKATGAQREIQTKKAALDKGFAEALTKIQEKVGAISASVAKEKGMNMVIAASQVVWGDSSLDVTDAVLKKLDAELPSVTVNVK